MTDTELEPQPAPAKRRPAPVPFPTPDPQPESGEAPEAPTAAVVSPELPLAEQPVPETEPPPAPTRRAKREGASAAVTVPWESALPGVRSSEIRAELARRERRAAELLAERERIVAEMDAIEAARDAIGEDAPEA